MMVAGKPENRGERRFLPLPGHSQPAMQYCFGPKEDPQWLFYWHYTMPRRDEDLDPVQRLHQRLRYLPSSLTIEVFARGVPLRIWSPRGNSLPNWTRPFSSTPGRRPCERWAG